MAEGRSPRVGIPLALDGARRLRPGRRTHYLDTAYSRALAEAGALTVGLLGPVDAEEAVTALDGLLLPGGDDFLPPRPYPPDVVFDAVPEEQVAFDAALLAEALERGLPVLGICYGMQLLARHHGGVLLYDIATDRPDALPHRAPVGDAQHPLAIEAGTRLATLLDAAPVNSRHHQAVAEPGQGLRVSARAPDGIVEAIEATAGPFVVGVQWHPESQADAGSRRLLHAFVEACAEAARGRR